MRYFALIFILVFLVFSCQKKHGNLNFKKPVTQLVLSKKDSLKKFYISFSNNGEGYLYIENIQPSCNCIVNQFKPIKLKPHSTDSVLLTYHNIDTIEKSERIVFITKNTIKKINFVEIHKISD